MFYESREFPYGNKEKMRRVKASLNRKDRRNLREIYRIENEKGKLEIALDTARKLTNATTAITAIPVGTSAIMEVTSLALSFGAIIILAFNSGMEQTEETSRILNSIKASINGRTDNMVAWGNVFVKGFPPFLLSAISRISIGNMLKHIQNRKETKEERITDKIIENDDIRTIIEDITVNRQDLSLNFIKEFLSSVDIKGNSREFNMQLLSNLAEYRTAVLKEERNEGSKEDTESKFIDFIGFLMQSRIIDGASQDFTDSPYVRDLIKTYGDLVPIEQEGKSKFKIFRCRKGWK